MVLICSMDMEGLFCTTYYSQYLELYAELGTFPRAFFYVHATRTTEIIHKVPHKHTQNTSHNPDKKSQRHWPGDRVSSRSTEPKACSRCLLSLATLTPPEVGVGPTFSFTVVWDVDAAAIGVGGTWGGGWLAGAAVGVGVSGWGSGTEGVTSMGSENGIPEKKKGQKKS